MMKEGVPIFGRIHKGEKKEDKKIGEGFETGEMDQGRGVRRKVYETPSGDFIYVDRTLKNEYQARRVMDIHKRLTGANLPVPSFVKVLRRKEEGEYRFLLAMEDLTENGNYEVTELSPHDTPQIAESAEEPLVLKHKMVRALAVLHNNRIFDFHPGLSLVLRKPVNDKHGQVDFKFIDYPNLTHENLPKGWDGEINFEEECSSDLLQLLRSICRDKSEHEELKAAYIELRESDEKTYMT